MRSPAHTGPVPNYARFTINATASTTGGFDAASAAALTFALEGGPASVVQRWELSVFDANDPGSPLASKNAPTVTLVGATSGQAVQAVSPSANITSTLPTTSSAQSWIVRSRINGGKDANGRDNADYVFERMVSIRAPSSGRRKVVAFEATQYGPRSTADAQNEDVDLAIVTALAIFPFTVLTLSTGASAATNTTAITNALSAAAAAGGGTVYIPNAGTYNIDPFTISGNNVVLECAPGVILQTTTTNTNIITLSGIGAGCRRVYVKTSGTATAGAHFRLTGADAFAERCMSEAGWNSALTSTAARQRVENCNVVTALNGALLIGNTGFPSPGAIVRGNIVQTAAGPGIYLVECSDCVVEGNQVLAATGAGTDGMRMDGAVVRAKVVGNTIANAADEGIFMNGCDDCVVTGNTVSGCGTFAVDVANGCTGCIVKNNLLVGNGTNSVAIPALTLASDTISLNGDFDAPIQVDSEGGAATDNCATINGGRFGQVLIVRAFDSAHDIVMKDGTGNLRLNGDFTLTHSDDLIALLWTGSVWQELSRSDNTA